MIDKIKNALDECIDAINDYLPPNGISKDEFISRIIEALDNKDFNGAYRAVEEINKPS